MFSQYSLLYVSQKFYFITFGISIRKNVQCISNKSTVYCSKSIVYQAIGWSMQKARIDSVRKNNAGEWNTAFERESNVTKCKRDLIVRGSKISPFNNLQKNNNKWKKILKNYRKKIPRNITSNNNNINNKDMLWN